ncbi:hypothetical protein FGG08_000639 [Glutinoglossum americanum]|uniref:Uncharacterized protein n=1 Tax=Glutinoglossum americanum TaxID=1670608 RepID=A0A9P8L5X7_9PEZI|nr:hypothetical protein FGG08_000639 [Glutinoglossum americanum]
MPSTQDSNRMKYNHQSFQYSMAREQEPESQTLDTGVPQRWQIDQGALHINFLARILYEEMVKYNNILQLYYNSLLRESEQSHDLENVIRDLQKQVQASEIKRITAEGRMRTLQVDYKRLATFYNRHSSVTPDTPTSSYKSASFSPVQSPIRDIQPRSKRKADSDLAYPMPKRAQDMAGTSLVTPTVSPLKMEDIL